MGIKKIEFSFFIVVFALLLSQNASAQEEGVPDQGLQVGVKSHFLNLYSPYKKLISWNNGVELRYVKPEVRWAIGYQYFNLFNSKVIPQGFYGEADFLAIDFTDKLRIGFPLRFYALYGNFIEEKSTVSGVLSVGSNLHYRIHEHWEIGLELGYIGYGRILAGDVDHYGFVYPDRPGISIYYAF